MSTLIWSIVVLVAWFVGWGSGYRYRKIEELERSAKEFEALQQTARDLTSND